MKDLRIELEYSLDSVNNVIDSATMDIHYNKHHKAYNDNYQNLVKDSKFAQMSVQDVLKNINEVPENIRQGVINNGGGIINHNLYFENITPNKVEMSDDFKNLVTKNFEAVANFYELIIASGLKQFGSGWVFVVQQEDELTIITTKNQDNPIMENKNVILAIDVWEHAYYLKYQNLRNEYLKSVISIIDWNVVESRIIK